MKTELERIAELAMRFSARANEKSAHDDDERIRVGIGDDAAVLDLRRSAKSIVWTVDAQVEGTHFRLDWLDWKDVGYRSFMAAASDIAAMGATPIAALSALILTPCFDDEALTALTEGQAEAARLLGAPIIGGNLARGDRETSITTTLLGETNRAIARDGARAGDGVWLGGDVGLAAAGMIALAKNVQDARINTCISAWKRPNARVDLGRAIAANEAVTAAIDVSDGLALDVSRIADASNVTFVLSEVTLRSLRALDVVGAIVGRDGLDLALHGGEDYALVVTSPTPVEGFVQIGIVTSREDFALMLEHANGSRAPIELRGFDHFAPPPPRLGEVT